MAFSNMAVYFSGGVFAADSNIYMANNYGQVIKFETMKSSFKIIGMRIFTLGRGWGRPILGADKCIYFPPLYHDRVMKFNPSTQEISLIGDSYDRNNHFKWSGGILASDGFIYCEPSDCEDILQIDSRHNNEQVLEVVQKMYVGHYK